MNFRSARKYFVWSSVLMGSFVALWSTLTQPVQALTLDVYGNVAPETSQLHATIESNKTNVQQDESITYTIKYNIDSAAPLPVTVEASWTLGTITGSPGSQFPVVEYEVGSGSQGFQNTSPVYDPTNRKLSWYIPSFSQADGEQTVTFRLKTNSSHQQSSTVTFSTSAVLISTTTSLASTVSHTYTYAPPASTPGPSPTPTPSPSSGSGSGNSGSSGAGSGSGTSTGQRSIFEVKSVTLRERTDTQVTFHIRTSHPDQLVIRYGTDQKNLLNSVVLTTQSIDHFLTLAGLTADTQYYFTIEPTQAKYLRNFTPRLVSFKTAQSGASSGATGPTVPNTAEASAAATLSPSYNLPDNFTIVSQYGNILNAAFRGQQNFTSIGFGRGTLEYNFTLPNSQHADQVSIAFGKLTSYPAIQPNTTFLPLESEFAAQYLPSRAWSARVNVPTDPGTYMVILRRQNAGGSLGETTLGLLTVSTPLLLQDATDQPLAGIRMDLERLNEDTQLYEPIAPTYFAPNKYFMSDATGAMFFPPLTGRYKATFSHEMYLPKSVEFTVDNQATQLPIVTLEKRPLRFGERFLNFWQRIVMWLGKLVGLRLEK